MKNKYIIIESIPYEFDHYYKKELTIEEAVAIKQKLIKRSGYNEWDIYPLDEWYNDCQEYSNQDE